MKGYTVSIVRYEKPMESVRTAIALSKGLDHMPKNARVFIKPNIVFWTRSTNFPKWGTITSSRVVEDIVVLLKEKGIGDITIGEGMCLTDPRDKKTPAQAFESLGYGVLKNRYGVKYLDVMDRSFENVDLGDGVELMFNSDILHSDFVINLPTMKAHNQTVVSLGIKNQGVATLALTEAYGLTKDPALREPVERAVAFVVRAQNKSHGGWRYKPGSADGDTSVVGWQVMALASARMAGLDVPEKSFTLASRWLDRVGGGKHGGLYGYQNKSPKPAMVAEGMFCQQLLGVPPTVPRMEESAAYIKTLPPARNKTNYYYWYYACLSLYQHQGPIWETWNKEMKKVLLGSQEGRGKNAGSWEPRGQFASSAGRAVCTAMATLSLEVYYRYLPMYRLPARRDGQPPR